MKANLWALALLLPITLSLGCAASYKERINQQLWEREMRLMEDCNYRLKWQIEDMQHALDDANARIQTLTKETGTLRDRGSSTGPDLTLPPALRSPNGTGRDSEAPTLPPAPGSLDVQPGREFSPGTPGRSSSQPPNSGASTSIDWQHDHDVSQMSFTAPAGRKPRVEVRLDPDANIERIILNPSLTGAIDAQNQSSSRALSVAIEQRDAEGKRVLAPGDLTIVVVDPALEGRAARIARWDFEANDWKPTCQSTCRWAISDSSTTAGENRQPPSAPTRRQLRKSRRKRCHRRIGEVFTRPTRRMTNPPRPSLLGAKRHDARPGRRIADTNSQRSRCGNYAAGSGPAATNFFF
jgi:hypothetical protein